jgi:mRNA-degrading endonuclease toxin of MazEF toxin-antitoxin module
LAEIPEPIPGLVIRYEYLWRREFAGGRSDAAKERPCAIVLRVEKSEGRPIVTVLPITHAAPADPDLWIEIPSQTKARLGLDSERAWIGIGEANRFT